MQGPFPVETPCVKCASKARVILGIQEQGENPVWALHENTHRPDENGEGGLWFHDLAAFCLYLCTDIDCATVTTLWNQA